MQDNIINVILLYAPQFYYNAICIYILYISFLNYPGGCHQMGEEKKAFHSENGMETLVNWCLWFHHI